MPEFLLPRRFISVDWTEISLSFFMQAGVSEVNKQEEEKRQ